MKNWKEIIVIKRRRQTPSRQERERERERERESHLYEAKCFLQLCGGLGGMAHQQNF